MQSIVNIHGKGGLTDMLILKNNKIITIGRDGYMLTFILKDHYLIKISREKVIVYF